MTTLQWNKCNLYKICK